MDKLYNFVTNMSDICFACAYMVIIMIFLSIGFQIFTNQLIGGIVGGFIGLMVATRFMMWYADDTKKQEDELEKEDE